MKTHNSLSESIYSTYFPPICHFACKNAFQQKVVHCHEAPTIQNSSYISLCLVKVVFILKLLNLPLSPHTDNLHASSLTHWLYMHNKFHRNRPIQLKVRLSIVASTNLSAFRLMECSLASDMHWLFV